MCEMIMVACDLHDKTMLLKLAVGRGEPEKLSLHNTRAGREQLIRLLKERSTTAGDAQVIFAYEASGLGFGLSDELNAAGIVCHVLAPTKITRSPQQKRRKTDEKDAQHILEILRGHVLAGNALPEVWVPDPQLRDDRELVRARLDTAQKITMFKAQIKSLLKRSKAALRDAQVITRWTRIYRAWLKGLSEGSYEGLEPGARYALGSLLRQLDALEKETDALDAELYRLAQTSRYGEPTQELLKLKGVGLVTALVFLTEMGDLSRFRNRRQIGAFVGLAPSSHESGEQGDRKGHITHQGPARVRKVLCQATWSRVRTDDREQAAYQRIVKRNPKHKKIAVVASMRRLAIRMWHRGLEAQQRARAAPAATTPTLEFVGGVLEVS